MVDSKKDINIEVSGNLPRLVLVTTPLTSPQILLDKLLLKRPGNFDIETSIWNVSTKYYSARVRLEQFSLEPTTDLGSLDQIPNKEAFVYYFTSEDEISWLHERIEKIQNEYSPEIGLLFYNGSQKFSAKTEKLIDKVVQSSFLEYVSENDLSAVMKDDKNSGGLLGQDEKRGFERLLEALECSMWSNMQTKSNPAIAAIKKSQDLQPVDLKTPEQTVNQDQGLLNQQLTPEEQDADSILHLMQEINQLKERNKTLSDEERRKNAENMINRLAKMMDLNESDYDDEETFSNQNQ